MTTGKADDHGSVAIAREHAVRQHGIVAFFVFVVACLPAIASAVPFRPGTLPWSAAVWTSGQLSGTDAVRVQQAHIDSAGVAGSGVGVGAQIRWRNLVLGVVQDWNKFSFAHRESWTGGILGATVDLAPEVRLELIGLAGRHRFSQLGDEPWRSPRSANAVELPFVGMRPTVWLRLPSQMRAAFGVWLDVRADIGDRTLTVTYQDDGDPTTTQDVYQVGGTQTAVGLQIALEYEWAFGK